MAHVISRADIPRCGSEGVDGAYLPTVEDLKAQKTAFKAAGNSSKILAEGITVDLYVHVVAGSENYEDGWITQRELEDQITVIQTTFAPAGISFNFIGSQYVVNMTWVATSGHTSVTAQEMKRTLHVGDYRTLNLYIMKNFYAYGQCNIPMQQASVDLPERILLDGCIIRPETVPGGSQVNINEGKTATHEIGHWFGLWHTFESHGRIPPNPPTGCIGIGDEVDDTPAQQKETFGCPEGKDTCPSLPGLDAIHNFMDYSDDSCLNEFSAGQVERMYMIWQNYRADV